MKSKNMQTSSNIVALTSISYIIVGSLTMANNGVGAAGDATQAAGASGGGFARASFRQRAHLTTNLERGTEASFPRIG